MRGAQRVFLWVALVAAAQGVRAQGDSTKVYEDIRRFAGKSRFTQLLYDAIFVAPVDTADRRPRGPAKQPRDPNLRYRGRTIRHIHVRVMDPFGGDVEDSVPGTMNRLERLGNALHVRTRERIVRGRLLFAPGDALDPVRLSESERVLRSTAMVNDARVRAQPVTGTRDSADVFVVVLDRWTLDGGLSGDATTIDANAVERNLFGSGQELSQSFRYDMDALRPSWAGTHRVYSFGTSFVGSTAQYALEPDIDRVLFSLDRPFFSPVAKWAGNITLAHDWLRARTDTANVDAPSVPVADRSAVDLWSGMNLSASEGGRSDGMAERVIAVRYAETWYRERSDNGAWDTLFVGSRALLASFSLGARRYVKDAYLYRFARTEDVVEGMIWTTTAGVRWPTAQRALPYVGMSFTRAAYMVPGDHLSARIGFGGMLEGRSFVDAITLLDVDVFSRSFQLGRWRFRQFARLIAGRSINPSTSSPLRITGEQLVGFERPEWEGASKVVLRMDLVAYAPTRFLAFRFAPVLSIGVGTVAPSGVRPLSSALQPAFGMGVLVRNERLLIRGFQISFAWYPSIFADADVLRWDPLRSLALRSADLSPARPDVIAVP
ncbi:MAG: hypothetical protein JNM91_01850 [Flavobacteriales bacterium]|nr:hypothetical protein [Flavobacteriales bacterium]